MPQTLFGRPYLFGLLLVAAQLTATAPPPSGLPSTINEQEAVASGTWTWNSSGYDATWSNGAAAIMTVVSFTPSSVVINRTDTPGSRTAGLTAIYTGQISSAGNSIVNGQVTWTWPGVPGFPNTGTWTATWAASPMPPPSPVVITTTTLPDTVSGDAYQVQLTASGGQVPITWSVSAGGLPAGFTLSSTGQLQTTGNPAATPGNYSFTVAATDGHSTASQALTLAVLTPDCSQKINVNITQIAVGVNSTLSSNLRLISGWLYLTTSGELFGFEGPSGFPIAPPGILIDAGKAVSLKPGANVYETPKLAYINNMTEWSGSATYGRGLNSLVERNAVFSPTDQGPVTPPLLDQLSSPWTPSVNPTVTPFLDSPNVNLPLVDNRQQPLTRLDYTKGFTNYVACYFDSDDVPHTVATINWYAHYSGTVYVPEVLGVLFPRSTRFFQSPGNAVTYNIQQGADLPQPVTTGPLASCHQDYQNFPGTIPAVPPAKCTP